MTVGYSRVSTLDQNLDLQIDNLKKAGCEKIFRDKLSGAKAERPGLESLFEHIRKGDCIVVWKLDRLGRSLKDLIKTITRIENKGATFKSLTENIDTTTPSGKLIFHIFGSLAEFERSLIKERINAGLAAARARGKISGRKKGISKEAEKKAVKAASFYKSNWSATEICEELQITKPTLYKYLKLKGVTLRINEPKFEIIGS